MVARWLVASIVFAVGVFLVTVVTLAVLQMRRGGLDLKAVFAPPRFASFLVGSTLWSLAGLLYIVQAARLTAADLAGLHGAVVIGGWATTLGLWLLGGRLLSLRS